jgi:hypothetical protein
MTAHIFPQNNDVLNFAFEQRELETDLPRQCGVSGMSGCGRVGELIESVTLKNFVFLATFLVQQVYKLFNGKGSV